MLCSPFFREGLGLEVIPLHVFPFVQPSVWLLVGPSVPTAGGKGDIMSIWQLCFWLTLRDIKLWSQLNMTRAKFFVLLQIEEYFGSGQDIEWALCDGQLYLLQVEVIVDFN